MVTPTSLNGAGCATAVPAASVDANNKAANAVVFMDASLLSWILLLTGDTTGTLSVRGNMRKPARRIFSAGGRGRGLLRTRTSDASRASLSREALGKDSHGLAVHH